MISADESARQIKLSDGRMLGYDEHGENDNNVPASVGHYVAEAIPNCQAHFFEDEGHFSLPYNHMREILSILVG